MTKLQKTPNLHAIIKEGFNFDKRGNVSVDLALISLKIALESYFATYQSFRHRLHIFKKATGTHEELDFNHSNEYCERSADCIVHFQHFAELVCKTILRNDHPLLADVAAGRPEIVHKLLHGEELTTDEEAGVQSVEFSLALERLAALVDAKKLKDHADAAFFVKHKDTLYQLNKLRNRVWHRGLFILRYTALDSFVGGYILPFVQDVLKHPTYSSNGYLGTPSQPACGIDPITAIIEHFASENYDIGKVAFLKELGRAAYHNPLSISGKRDAKIDKIFSMFHAPDRARAEKIAKALVSHGDQVEDCPVCNVKSLVIYEDTDSYPSEENEDVDIVYSYTHTATCMNCTFDVHGSDMENASAYGLKGISDYWRYR
jgi:hypothetical protein